MAVRYLGLKDHADVSLLRRSEQLPSGGMCLDHDLADIRFRSFHFRLALRYGGPHRSPRRSVALIGRRLPRRHFMAGHYGGDRRHRSILAAWVGYFKDRLSVRSQREDRHSDQSLKSLDLLIKGLESMAAQLRSENEGLWREPKKLTAVIANEMRSRHEQCMKDLSAEKSNRIVEHNAQALTIARLNARVSTLELRLTDLGDFKLDSDYA